MEFQQEKEAREKAAEKQRVESDKQVTLSKILRLSIISPSLTAVCFFSWFWKADLPPNPVQN